MEERKFSLADTSNIKNNILKFFSNCFERSMHILLSRGYSHKIYKLMICMLKNVPILLSSLSYLVFALPFTFRKTFRTHVIFYRTYKSKYQKEAQSHCDIFHQKGVEMNDRTDNKFSSQNFRLNGKLSIETYSAKV